MVDLDMKWFRKLLDTTCTMLSKGAYVPNADSTMVFFRAMQQYSTEEVSAAMAAHVADPERGRFVPTPADLVRQIHARLLADGRPGADEAWATAIRSADESDTVVWTEETALAWTIARPVFDRGDEIGARMAFRDAYNRMVASARDRGVAASWVVSEGFDRERRAQALERAAKAGQLPQLEVQALLQIAGPAQVNGLADLMTRPDVPEHAREAFARFKERVAEKANQPGIDAVEKARTAELKTAAEKRVADTGLLVHRFEIRRATGKWTLFVDGDEVPIFSVGGDRQTVELCVGRPLPKPAVLTRQRLGVGAGLTQLDYTLPGTALEWPDDV